MNVDHKINVHSSTNPKTAADPSRSKRYLALAACLAIALTIAISLPLTLGSQDDDVPLRSGSQKIDGCYLEDNTHCNLAFGSHPLQKLDLYTTSAATAMTPAPCILYVHGGGWKGGDKDTNTNPAGWLLELRQRGYHIASTNYRVTSDGDRHPAQIEDVESAVVYLKEHAATYNLDPQKIVAFGTSAGGHLVSLLATRNGPESAARVAGVISFFGGTILYEAEGTIGVHMLLGCKTPDKANTACHAKAIDASPFAHVAASNPPYLILHGEDDPTVPVNASIRFQAQLESVGATSTLVIVPDVAHDKDRVACGQTGGMVNSEHIARWINATLSPGAPCDSIFCDAGTHLGDALDLYDGADAFLSPACLSVRAYGSTGSGGDYDDR